MTVRPQKQLPPAIEKLAWLGMPCRTGRESVLTKEGAGGTAAAGGRTGDCLRREVQGTGCPGHSGAPLIE